MVQSISDYLRTPAGGGSVIKGNWDMTPTLDDLLPTEKTANDGVVAIVDADNQTLAYGTTPPLLGGLYRLAIAESADVQAPGTVGTSRIRIPTFDPADTVAIVGYSFVPAGVDLTTLFSWSSMPDNPGDGRYSVSAQFTAASLASSGLPMVDNGVAVQLDVEDVLGATLNQGDDIYITVDMSNGEVYIQQNDNAAVLAYTFSEGFLEQEMTSLNYMLAVDGAVTFTQGTLNFDTAASNGGRTPTRKETPATVPSGAADNDRYIVTAGGPFGDKRTQTGDVVELINTLSEVIITRDPPDLSGYATKAEVADATSTLPVDGIIRESIIEIYSDYGFSLPSDIAVVNKSRKYILTEYSSTPYPQWAIDAGLAVGDLWYVDNNNNVVIMDVAPGQKISLTLHGIAAMPDGSAVPSTVVLENMSDRPNLVDEIFTLMGYEFDNNAFWRAVRDTNFAPSKEWVLSYIKPAVQSAQKRKRVDLRELLRGGIIVNDGTTPIGYERSLTRKIVNPFTSSANIPSFNDELNVSPDGRYIAWPAGTNVKVFDFETGVTNTLSAGASGGWEFCMWDPNGEYLYLVLGGTYRVRRYKLGGDQILLQDNLYDSGVDPAMGWGAFSPDGAYIAVGGQPGSYTSPGPDQNVRIIDTDTFTESQVVDVSAEIPVMGFAFHFDLGQDINANTLWLAYTATGVDASVYVRNITTPALLHTHSRADGNDVLGTCFLNSLEGAAPMLAVLSYNGVSNLLLEIVNPNTGAVVGSLDWAANQIIALRKYSLRLSPCGTYLFCAGTNLVDISDVTAPAEVASFPGINGRALWMHH